MRHPLPYAWAKAQRILLEDDGERLVLWADAAVDRSALAEVQRLNALATMTGRNGAAAAAISERDVARAASKYNLLSVPVVDQAGSLMGMVTVDDILAEVVDAA